MKKILFVVVMMFAAMFAVGHEEEKKVIKVCSPDSITIKDTVETTPQL